MNLFDTDETDGFSDVTAEGSETEVDSADPGSEGALKPLSPEEYAKAQKEAREED